MRLLSKSFVKFPRGVLLNTAILVLTCQDADSVTSKENYDCCKARIGGEEMNNSDPMPFVGSTTTEVQMKDMGLHPRHREDMKDLEKRTYLTFDPNTDDDTDQKERKTNLSPLVGITGTLHVEETVILNTSFGQSDQGLNAFATLKMTWISTERNGIGPKKRPPLIFGFRVTNEHRLMYNRTLTTFQLFVYIPYKGNMFHLTTDFRISTNKEHSGKKNIFPIDRLRRMADTDYILEADCWLVLAVLKCCLFLLPLYLILVWFTFKRTYSWLKGIAEDLVAQLRRLNDSLERFNA